MRSTIVFAVVQTTLLDRSAARGPLATRAWGAAVRWQAGFAEARAGIGTRAHVLKLDQPDHVRVAIERVAHRLFRLGGSLKETIRRDARRSRRRRQDAQA
jgi:hypothetical protein